MRSLLSPRTGFLGLTLIACTVVLLTTDSVSAQFRGRGGWSVGVGSGYYGSGYGGNYGSGYYGGYPGYSGGYRSNYYGGAYPYYSTGYYSPGYSSNYLGYGAYAPAYTSSPVYAGGFTYAGMPTYAGADGCCDNCGGAAAGGVVMNPDGTIRQAGYMAAGGEQGLRIVDVVQQGPAQTAGIVQGSVIESIDGQRVRTYDQLKSAIARTNGDKPVKIIIVDPNGQRRTHDLALKDNRIGVSVVETSVNLPNDSSTQPNRNDGTIPQQLPSGTTPGTTTPSTTTPDSTRPGSTLPQTTTPGSTLPGATVPGTTTPSTTTPSTTRPAPDASRPLDSRRPND